MGFFQSADARRQGLGSHDLRPGHGDAESVLGSRPALLRGDRRQVWHVARSVPVGVPLCERPLSDGECRPRAALLYLGGGVLVGLGVAAGSFGIVLSAFARNVSAGQAHVSSSASELPQALPACSSLRPISRGDDRSYRLVRYAGLPRHWACSSCRCWPFRSRQFVKSGRISQAQHQAVDWQRVARGIRPQELSCC